MYSVHNMCYVIFRTPCLACFVPENKLGECIIMSSTNHSSLLNMRGTIVVCDIFEYWTVIYALWDALSLSGRPLDNGCLTLAQDFQLLIEKTEKTAVCWVRHTHISTRLFSTWI